MCIDCGIVYPKSLKVWRSDQTEANAYAAIEDLERCLWLYDRNISGKGLLCRINSADKEDMYRYSGYSVRELSNSYDCKNASESICSFLNIMCCGMLKDGADLYRSLGMNEKSESLRNKACVLENAIIENLYDKKLGLFKDASSSEHHSLCVNASVVAYGIHLKIGNELVSSYVKRKRLGCDEAFADIVARALENMGEAGMAEEVLCKKAGDKNG